MGGINLLGQNKDGKKRRKKRREFSHSLTNPSNGAQKDGFKEHGASGFLQRLAHRGEKNAKHASKVNTNNDASKAESFSERNAAHPKKMHSQEPVQPTTIETAKHSLNERKNALDTAGSEMNGTDAKDAKGSKDANNHRSPFAARAPQPRKHESAPRFDVFSNQKLSAAPEVSRDGSLELNLVPGREKKRATPHRRLIQLGFVALGAVGVVLVAWGIAYYMQFQSEQTVEDVSDEVAALTAEIASLSDVAEREQEISAQASAVQTALEDQHYWSKFLDVLEETVIHNVYWKDLTADPGGAVTMQGVSATYADMIDQVDVLRDHPMISSVEIKSATVGGEGDIEDAGETQAETQVSPEETQFSLSLTFDSTLIQYSEDD